MDKIGTVIFRGFSIICHTLRPIMSSEMSGLYQVLIWHYSACRAGSWKGSIAPIPADMWRSNYHADGLWDVMMDTAEEVQVFRIRIRPIHNPEGQHDDNLYHRLEKTYSFYVALKRSIQSSDPGLHYAGKGMTLKDEQSRSIRLCGHHRHSLRLNVFRYVQPSVCTSTTRMSLIPA